MSDTPQVDALDFGDQSRFPGPGYGDLWELARNLEREHAALRERAELAEKELRAAREMYAKESEALKSGGGRGLLREPVQAAPNDPTTLLGRVKARRGSDQIRKLRGERPQDDPWPWIHEGELIAEVERLQSLLSRSIAPFDEVPECPERLHGSVPPSREDYALHSELNKT